MHEYITEVYGSLIEDLVNRYELRTGDISLDLSTRLEQNKKDLVQILLEFVMDNS